MMRTVHLHGRLKREFGPSFRFDIDTAGEALRALNCAFPNAFVETLKEGSYQLIRGRRHGGMALDLEQVNAFRLGGADLHIIPVIMGAGNSKGAVKAILGVALIGAAIFFSGGALATPIAGLANATGLSLSWGSVGLMGLSIALTGVGSMLAGQQKPLGETKDDHSYAFGGPVNVNEQGNAIPLIYGECIVGSQPISSGFDIEDLGALKEANANSGVPIVPAAPITEDPTP